ncbi:hypothetical protein [Aeromicrobium sp. Leaf350]|uniref:hypothetical protein n=1 Tax=Aeromicrobium sp. Leaf350 TaxID=2876565 RepID=UPI001E5F1737|nr:hypothetical protein [Aeromicrobium sp. Leaf350]
MNRRRAGLGGGLVVAAAIVFAAFALHQPGNSESQDRNSLLPNDGSHLTELAVGEPLSTPGEFDDAPNAPSGLPSLKLTKDLSEGDDSRTVAEGFAVALLHLVIDTREPMDVGEMVETLVAEDADPATVDYFETSLALNNDSEVRRIWRTDKPSYVRTQVDEGAMSIEVALTLGLEGDDTFQTWVTHRLDLRRTDGGWLVTQLTFRTLDYMPSAGASMAQVLDGNGWRLLGPGQP